MNNKQHNATRRDFIRRVGFGSAILAMLGGGGVADPLADGAANSDGSGVAVPTCPGADALTEQQKQARRALKYTDASPHADKRCSNCRFFKAPATGKTCGACTALPGPVHPRGHCTAWIIPA